MEPLWSNLSQLAMDCTAAILKACARSRSQWCRHKRSASARTSLGCCCGRGATVICDASSFLHRLLVYICCCRSSEESSELCQEWVDPPIGESGRGEDEGESEEFCWATQDSGRPLFLILSTKDLNDIVFCFVKLFGLRTVETNQKLNWWLRMLKQSYSSCISSSLLSPEEQCFKRNLVNQYLPSMALQWFLRSGFQCDSFTEFFNLSHNLIRLFTCNYGLGYVMRTDDQQIPISVSGKPLGAVGGIVGSFMVICSSKLSQCSDGLQISLSFSFFFLTINFSICQHIAEWLPSLSVSSLWSE